MNIHITKILLIILFLIPITANAEIFNLPHVEAINLVAKTQFTQINNIDEGSSQWFDAKLREWSVKRPFGPGVIDSTHMFIVTYKIEGKPIISWSVNTKMNTVSQIESVK